MPSCVGEADRAIAEGEAWSQTIMPVGFAAMGERDRRAIQAVIERGATAADVRCVAQWLIGSGDGEARFFRKRALGWATVCNDRWQERVALARAWEVAGRSDDTPTRSEPLKARSRMDHMRDLAARFEAEESVGRETNLVLMEARNGDQIGDD